MQRPEHLKYTHKALVSTYLAKAVHEFTDRNDDFRKCYVLALIVVTLLLLWPERHFFSEKKDITLFVGTK